MSDDVLDSDGGVHYRDPDAERDADHYGPGTGGKKRKVPAFTQTLGRQDEIFGSSRSDDEEDDIELEPAHFALLHRAPRSKAATAYAQNAITNGSVKPGTQGLPHIMDIPTFEQLMPSLEDIDTTDWPPDKLNWRSRWEGQPATKTKTLEQWKTGFDQRLRKRSLHKPTVRGGWAPEGSFEFEMPSKASATIRSKIKDRALLHKLVVDLRSLTLAAKPLPQPLPVQSSLEKPPQKTQRMSVTKRPEPLGVKSPPPISRSPSKESDPASNKSKTKKKKKKRSVLANQGNPHHVDNYRPSRRTNMHSDPFEPYPHHESLLFPPPMRLLSTVPQRRTAPLPGVNPTSGQIRAAEDEFICCFCEMDLFFGTEKARRRAIRRMKEERRRKESIRNKAKDFAEGKGKLQDDESDYEDDEDWCGEEDGHGRCTCGRQISEPHRSVKSRLKPPETDPPPVSDVDDPHYNHQHDHARGQHEHSSCDAGGVNEEAFTHDDLD